MTDHIDCTICLEACIAYPELVTTKCGHTFHRKCLKDWLNKNNVCPNCKGSEPWAEFVPLAKPTCPCCGANVTGSGPNIPTGMVMVGMMIRHTTEGRIRGGITITNNN
jgi:hypothetical protein